MSHLRPLTRLILLSAICTAGSCAPAADPERAKAEREAQIASQGKNCELHGSPMKRKPEVQIGSYPFEAATPFYEKQRRLFYNDGTTFLGCGYLPPEMTWICDECASLSKRELRRRGISD